MLMTSQEMLMTSQVMRAGSEALKCVWCRTNRNVCSMEDSQNCFSRWNLIESVEDKLLRSFEPAMASDHSAPRDAGESLVRARGYVLAHFFFTRKINFFLFSGSFVQQICTYSTCSLWFRETCIKMFSLLSLQGRRYANKARIIDQCS